MARFRLTVQVLALPGLRDLDLQLRSDIPAADAIAKGAVLDTPFNVVVRTTVRSGSNVSAAAAKLAEVAPAGTLSVAGIVSTELSPDTVTILPPAGAGSFKVTVQVLLEPATIVRGLQVSAATSNSVTKVKPALCWRLFRVAVMFTFWPVEMVPLVTVKLAVAAPAATDTKPGTKSWELLSDNVTLLPEGGAA